MSSQPVGGGFSFGGGVGNISATGSSDSNSNGDNTIVGGDPRRDSKISLSIHTTRRSTDAESTASEHQRRRNDFDISKFTAAPFGLDLFDSRTSENRALLWKQDLRIIPLCAFIYLLCYLDRSNIANARVMNTETSDSLEQELSLSDSEYAIALTLFSLGYTLFEVPSNMLLKRLTPSIWISILMFSWGVITIGTGFVKSTSTLYFTRFILGFFEAGLLPGLIYYLTFWYRIDERSLRVALILASATLAGAFGGAIAFGISHGMNNIAALSSWQWLFILEGIPSCIAAGLVYFFLPDYPENSPFLSPQEKHLAQLRLAHEGSHAKSPNLTLADVKATLTDYRLYAHYLLFFFSSVSFSSLSLFTPSITTNLGYSSISAQLMTVPPWAVSYVLTIIVAVLSDRYNARALLSAGSMALSCAGFLASAVLPPGSYKARYAGLCVACAGVFASTPPLLGWLSGNVGTGGSAARAGLAIALNVSLGTPGQIVGVWIYKTNEKDKGWLTGHWTNVGMMFSGAVGSVMLWWWYRKENRRIMERGEEERRMWKL